MHKTAQVEMKCWTDARPPCLLGVGADVATAEGAAARPEGAGVVRPAEVREDVRHRGAGAQAVEVDSIVW